MGDETSEQILSLLGELSVLKELNAAFENNPDESERTAYEERQRREQEIKVEMLALRDQKKAADRALADQ